MEKIVLNKEQKRAIEHQGKPLLIIAGAGTGKTTVITERIKSLIVKKAVLPQEILGLTFTEKAAREMQERVDKAVPYGYTQTWIMTFHSFCDRILRNEAVNIGLNPAFRLTGEAESTKLLLDNLWEIPLEYFRPRGNPAKFVNAMLNHFNRLKDEDITPPQYELFIKKFKTEDKQEIKKLQELVTAYKIYEELKIKSGLMDFADLISNTLFLFRSRPNILSQYREKFKYILIDEFQDTNIAQYELMKLLTPDGITPNLTVVGDDSQSIYKFRGAAVSNILSFMNDYKEAQQIILTKNYRSTQTILNHAYQLIKHNDPDTLEAKLGIDKNLIAIRKNVQQYAVKLLYHQRVEEEAEAVAKTIKDLKEKNSYNWQDFALLIRANNHSEPFIRAFKRQGIPYQFLGPGQLFRQEEVRELIAYLKTLAHFEDSTSFYKVLAMDLWGISGRDLAALNSTAKWTHLSLFEVCEEVVKEKEDNKRIDQSRTPYLREETIQILKKIVKIIHRHLDLVPKESAGQILYYFLEDSGMLPKLIAHPENLTQEKRVVNISRFFDKIKAYESAHEDVSVFAVCDWIDLSLELGESPLASEIDWTEEDRVNIITAHSAKGLEFPVVFLVNLVNHRFPSLSRKELIPIPEALIQESLPFGDFHLQEERRLFYVGMTRARDRLYFTASKYYAEGKKERVLSPFVIEALGKTDLSVQMNQDQSNQLELFDEWVKTEDKTEIRKIKNETLSFLSYSQITTFKFCPLHYKLKYLLKLPTPISAAQSFGTSIHAALRDYYRILINGEKGSRESLLKFLEVNWIKAGYANKKEAEKNLKEAQQYLNDFYDQEGKKPFVTKAVEEKFKFPLNEKLKIAGVIDRIDLLPDNKIEIIDYKTAETIPDQKTVDKDLQLTIYALAATEVHHPLLFKRPQEVLLSLYFFEEQKKITTTRTIEQLTKAKEEILEIAQKIETSDFSCSGNIFCKRCEYKLYCNTV